MRIIDRVYIDGSFVEPHGEHWAPLFNPATEEQIGKVRLADEEDANRAVAAARRAFPAFSNTSKEERITMLKRLHAAVSDRAGDLAEAMRIEYGAPSSFIAFAAQRAGNVFLDMAEILESYDFRRRIGRANVEMRPSGVAVAITPWNSNYSFICGKLSAAIASGSTMVIKPSESRNACMKRISQRGCSASSPATAMSWVRRSPQTGMFQRSHSRALPSRAAPSPRRPRRR
jgi:aldehyde dehydrogenase (NAD+)